MKITKRQLKRMIKGLVEEAVSEQEYDWKLPTSGLWGNFDFGTVTATSTEDALEKAKAELKKSISEINSQLDGYDIDADVDEVSVQLAS